MKYLIPLLLVVTLPAFGQEKPDAPKPSRRVFVIGTVSLAAAKTYDAITTENLLRRGGWENNPLYGKHPSPTRLALTNAALFAGEVAVFHLTERSPHKWVRVMGRGFLTVSVADHIRAGACNSSINPMSPVHQSCSPFAH